MKNSPLLFGFTFLFGSSLSAEFLGNVGFEDGSANWTFSQNSGTATGGISTAEGEKKEGNAGYKVDVTTIAAGTDFPKFIHDGFTSSSDDTYLISFFARCPGSTYTERPAKLRINIAGGNAHNIDFQPTDKWEEYHFPFKLTADGPASLDITFETPGVYLLDEVQLLNQSEPIVNSQSVMDPGLTYLWRWRQNGGGNRINGTDNTVATQLPNGNVVWLFNDTDRGDISTTSNYRGDAAFLRNYGMIQNGPAADLNPLNNGGFALPKRGQITDQHNSVWPNDALSIGDKLIVCATEIEGFGTSVGGSALTFSPPNYDNPTTAEVPWDDSQLLDGGDGYIYIFREKKVARVPREDFADGSQWAYYRSTNNNRTHTWEVGDPSRATESFDFGDSFANSIERLGPNNYVAIGMGFVGADVRAQFAPNPWGPWTPKEQAEVIYTVPFEDGHFYYEASLLKHTVQNGSYKLAYSDFRFSPDSGKKFDLCYYFPQFIRTPNLLALSPHSGKELRDDFADGDAVGWQNFGGTWSATTGELSATSGDGHKSIAKGILREKVHVEVDVTPTNCDAGVIFRAGDYSVGPDAYRGYYAGIDTTGRVVLGRADNGPWTFLETQPLPITSGNQYHLKVTAEGPNISVYVDDMLTPIITFNDNTYSSGGIGVRAYRSAASWDNFSVPPANASPGEIWRFANFDNVANINSAADDADPDGDGLSNLLERSLNLDPNVPSLENLPTFVSNATSDGLQYQRSLAATDLSYQVQWSENLTQWNDSGITDTPLSQIGSIENRRGALPSEDERDRLFLRLQVSQ